MVRHAEGDGRGIMRVARCTADMATDDMAAVIDAVEDVAGRTHDADNAL